MQDWLRRMRLREELLNGTEKAPTPKAERNPATEKQIGAILLPQNLHLAPVVRNHETSPMEPTSSHPQQKTEGGQTRTERIAEQLGRFHDGYQKYRHPVEYAKAQANEKLREKFMEKAQEKLGAERFAKLQKHAAAYQKIRHPVRHVKSKAKQAAKKAAERFILMNPWLWVAVGVFAIGLFLVLLVTTIWEQTGFTDKLKGSACLTTGVGCESFWNNALSAENMSALIGPSNAEGAVPPRGNDLEVSLRADLASHGIGVRSTGNCSDQNNPSCTSLAGLPASALDTLKNIKRACAECDITITGGVETGHQTHGTGEAVVDLGFDQKTAEFLFSKKDDYGITKICTTPAQKQFRVNCNADETESHLHIEF